eukprot:TRINITY_DN75738_c0_g1_i1.p1 TRINITY_DN75738_c0_g1~~TRINITY_DN75738_c0_g1_i1.p1  ORF type:complete len:164 (-),score=1.67 TRINITY_DN75738_c0_g1_i1:149-640(-)
MHRRGSWSSSDEGDYIEYTDTPQPFHRSVLYHHGEILDHTGPFVYPSERELQTPYEVHHLSRKDLRSPLDPPPPRPSAYHNFYSSYYAPASPAAPQHDYKVSPLRSVGYWDAPFKSRGGVYRDSVGHENNVSPLKRTGRVEGVTPYTRHTHSTKRTTHKPSRR